MTPIRTLLAATAAVALTAGAATAETHVVKMLNADPEDRSERMVFEPAVLQVAPGDTVRFVPEDPGHNAVSEAGPEGAVEFRGGINKEIEVTFEEEGTHLYICQPHLALGMVGLVLVGDYEQNLDEIAEMDLRGRRSDERLDAYVEQARGM